MGQNDHQIVALVLQGNFGVILDKTKTTSVEITDVVAEKLASEGISLAGSQSGSDGIQVLVCTQYGWFPLSRVGGEENGLRTVNRTQAGHPPCRVLWLRAAWGFPYSRKAGTHERNDRIGNNLPPGTATLAARRSTTQVRSYDNC